MNALRRWYRKEESQHYNYLDGTRVDSYNNMNHEKTWKMVGWTGASLVVAGYYLNANMHVSGWLVWIIGNGLVAVYSWYKEAYPTMVMSLVILIMNIYGFLKWL